MLKFSKLVPNRKSIIENGSKQNVLAVPPMNKLAKEMHPKFQEVEIKNIIEETKDVKTYILSPIGEKNLAYFRAGQYISIKAKIKDSILSRPYSLSSSPSQALKGEYSITIKNSGNGFFSEWANKSWEIGNKLTISAPEGTFYYEPIRDAKNIIGICGGSGVTPFYSLAKAIVEGNENCNLTLLYGNKKEEDIIFKKKFDELQKKSNGKLKVIVVLSDEKKEGFEEGYITAKLIKKYAPKDEKYSIFICGPQVMYDFVKEEIKILKLKDKFIRRELFGEIKVIEKVAGYPKELINKVFKLKVKFQNEEKTIDSRADESILVAIERAGIITPSKCRSGICGYCRSKLISGDVFIPSDSDGRRAADKKNGYVHICSSYPLSDLSIELPNC